VHGALRTGNLEIVRLVLEHGGDPDEREGIGGEPPPFRGRAGKPCEPTIGVGHVLEHLERHTATPPGGGSIPDGRRGVTLRPKAEDACSTRLQFRLQKSLQDRG
jgi:hypothetical protein